MIALLETIVNLFTSILSFIVNTLKSFLLFISFIPEALVFVGNLLDVLPDELLVFATLGIGLTVLAMLMRHQIL